MDVDLGGLHGLMSEPEGDHRLIDAVMEQVHRGAVPKRVRRDPLGADARARARSGQAVLADQMFERIAAQMLAADRREQRPDVVAAVADPRCEQLGRVAAQRRAALLPSLAHAADMRAAAEHCVAALEVHQLGCPQAGLDREQEQRMIAPSRPCRAIRRRQQRRDLARVEERHRAPHIALARHREDALAVQQPGWIGHRDVAEERADRGEPRVAAARAVPARRLSMKEEVGDQISVDVLDRELDRRLAVPGTREPQQQTERVAIACDRMRAGLHLGAQPVGEEALDQRGQGRGVHWSASPPEVARAIARSSSSGTASRYQNVLAGSV